MTNYHHYYYYCLKCTDLSDGIKKMLLGHFTVRVTNPSSKLMQRSLYATAELLVLTTYDAVNLPLLTDN